MCFTKKGKPSNPTEAAAEPPKDLDLEGDRLSKKDHGVLGADVKPLAISAFRPCTNSLGDEGARDPRQSECHLLNRTAAQPCSRRGV